MLQTQDYPNRYKLPVNKERGAEFVIRRARQLIKLSGITSPPFFPERYARLQRVVRIVKEDLGQTAGLLLPIENGYEIRLNAKHSPVRQTFSCAHEIGHTFFLEKEGKQILGVACAARGKRQSNYWLENLCDLAAAELLMPASIFSRYATRYHFDIKSILPLSQIFATSIQSTAIRLCDLNPRTCYLMSSEQCSSIELNEPILRNSWLTWSGLKEPPPRTKGRLLFNQKIYGGESNILRAYKSDEPTYFKEHMAIMNYRGNCQIWSLGVNSGKFRSVLSFIYPEYSE